MLISQSTLKGLQKGSYMNIDLLKNLPTLREVPKWWIFDYSKG